MRIDDFEENPEQRTTFYEDSARSYYDHTGRLFEEECQKILDSHGPDIDAQEFFDLLPGLDQIVSLAVEESRRFGHPEPWAQGMFVISGYWYNYRFFVSHRKTFSVSEGLGVSLSSTPLKVQRAFLRLPFKTISIYFQNSPLELWDVKSRSHRFLGCILTETDRITVSEKSPAKDADELYTRIQEEGTSFFGEDEVPGIRVFILGEGANESWWVDETAIPLTDDPSQIISEETVRSAILLSMAQVSEEQMNHYMEASLMALRAVAYMNSGSADLVRRPAPAQEILDRLERVGPSKKKKLQRRLEKLSRLPYIVLGEKIRANRETVVQSDKGYRRLTYRHKVRGHWQSYWKKEENLTEDERKMVQRSSEGAILRRDGKILVLKHIDAYDRGPDTGDIIHRDYRLEENPYGV